MEVGQIISGYQNELGVTLNSVSHVENGLVTLEVALYEPDDPKFAWALEQLAALDQS